MTWQVPRIWVGQTVAVLASGPSMTQAVADAARSVPTIVVNDTFRLAPWAALLYAADEAWWQANPDALAFAGLKVSVVSSIPGVECLRSSGSRGFDADPRCIRTGSNSGYQAVHIAAQAGAARILLCGFDMSAEHGAHWFGPHQAPLGNTEAETYARFVQRFQDLMPAFEELGIEVVNCTPGSALRCFRFGVLEEELGDAP